jgi:hypothetical protein
MIIVLRFKIYASSQPSVAVQKTGTNNAMLSPAHLAKQLMQKKRVGNKGATKKPQPFDMSEEEHSKKA